ncbi:hypothetical protein ACOMHN_012591 [Nucella lapillus]
MTLPHSGWMRLLRKVKSSKCVEHVSSTPDGRLRCVLKKKPGQERNDVVLVSSPDGLFCLGFDDINYEELGLHHLIVHQSA